MSEIRDAGPAFRVRSTRATPLHNRLGAGEPFLAARITYTYKIAGD